MAFDMYILLLLESNSIKFLSVPHLESRAGLHLLSGFILLVMAMIQEVKLLSKRAWH
jgi:hypothetical protein